MKMDEWTDAAKPRTTLLHNINLFEETSRIKYLRMTNIVIKLALPCYRSQGGYNKPYIIFTLGIMTNMKN